MVFFQASVDNMPRLFFSKMAAFPLSVLSVFVILYSITKGENTTLLLVQTLSRHGDKEPVKFYPSDLDDKKCFPRGEGELSELGWKQQYDFGIFLRSLYSGFNTQDPKQIYVNSAGEDRCVRSAAAQLTSFYAPDEELNITNLHWQPIPIHSLPPIQDKYLNYQSYCPRGEEAHIRGVFGAEDRRFSKKQKAKIVELSHLLGADLFYPTVDYFLYVQAYVMRNCSLPEWAYKHFDELKKLYETAVRDYHQTNLQKRLYFGPFLGLVNNNMKNKISGKSELKFVLNFTHDVEILGVLSTLNFTDVANPPYCATLLFELHQMSDASMAVRLRYINTTDPLNDEENQPFSLILDGCTEFCPVDNFMKHYESFIPDDWEKECQIDTQ